MLYLYLPKYHYKKQSLLYKKFYVKKARNTTITKNIVRKLMKDTCKNAAFVFDNEIYKQIDDVSMGSPLTPVLTNIIMIELQNTIIYLIPGKKLLSLPR